MKPLRLKAVDDDDLEVFATVLQSARMPLAEVTWLAKEQRFAALFRRFCYEQAGADMLQVDCVLVLETVSDAAVWDLEGLGGEEVAELMTIVSGYEGTSISFVFSCGGLIKLDTAKIDGRLADIGEPVPAEEQPRYAGAPGDQ